MTPENATPVVKETMNKKSAFAYTVGYSAGQLAWYMINNYLMLFYTDVVGLAAGAISMIMLIARIWDAVNDPMMGAIVDRTNTRWGKFKPYIAIAPAFLAVFNVLTFTVFPLEGTTKVVVCLLCYIGAGMAYTAVGISVNGFVNRLAKDSQVKMDIIAMAQVGSTIMQTIIGAVAMPLILFFSKSDVATGEGYLKTIILFSLAALPLYIFMVINCKEVVTDAPVVKATAQAKPKKSLGESLSAISHNKQMLIALFSVFIGAFATIARMSMLSYYLIYVAGAYTVIAPVFSTISFMQMIGNLTLPFMTRKIGKIRTFVSFMLLNAVTMVVLFFSPAGNVPILLALSVLYGFTNSGSSICYSMLSDSIDYGEYEFGVRDDALPFSFMTLSVKAATAIVGACGVLLLTAVGYVAGADQTESTRTGINVIVNLGPGIIGMLAMVPMFWYKLDEKKMRQIRQELDERNAAAQAKA